jgi:hypothetical protein
MALIRSIGVLNQGNLFVSTGISNTGFVWIRWDSKAILGTLPDRFMRIALSIVFALSVFTWAAQAPAVKVTTPAPAATGFVGNKESKVFHLPTCKLVIKIKPGNRVTFGNRQEATTAGYTPCKICLR